MKHLFHEWPWEGQENPQHVGQGPNLISWQGASQWDPGGYPVEDAYLWYDRYCEWLQDLLYGRRAEVDVEDAVVGARTDPGTIENREGLSRYERESRRTVSLFDSHRIQDQNIWFWRRNSTGEGRFSATARKVQIFTGYRNQ